eukprot:3941518-Rhodomonas_salina.1
MQHTIPGTDVAYGATRWSSVDSFIRQMPALYHPDQVVCYAISGTGIADTARAAVSYRAMLCAAMCGTDTRYRAMRRAVLTLGMVLPARDPHSTRRPKRRGGR